MCTLEIFVLVSVNVLIIGFLFDVGLLIIMVLGLFTVEHTFLVFVYLLLLDLEVRLAVAFRN